MINQSNAFNVNLNQFSGPLDLLLDLAKSQKVKIEDISITKLADQFLEYISKAEKLNLDIASEYLVMATWLAYLKSKLLLPQTEEDESSLLEARCCSYREASCWTLFREGESNSSNFFRNSLSVHPAMRRWTLISSFEILEMSASRNKLSILLKKSEKVCPGSC